VSLGTLVERWARERPHRPALICEGKTVTFLELDKWVNRTANGLRKLGIGRGDSVAIMLPNIPEFVYVFYACQKLGAVAVPFNTMYKGREITHILRDCRARAIVCLTNSVTLINEIRSELPDLKHVITTGERTLNFADPDSTLFVQAVLSQAEFRDLDEAYRRMGQALLGAFHAMGLGEAWYLHRGSLRAGGRKVAGFLISEVEDMYIVNAVCFLGRFDPTDFFYALWVPPEVKDKALEPLTSAEEHLGKRPSNDAFKDAIVDALKKEFGVTVEAGAMTREERFGYAKQLALARRKTGKPAPGAPGPLLKRIFASLFGT
jgi:long-chain acyl-CoA synthetase